jgi:poly-D-alanine transfer protein DltD
MKEMAMFLHHNTAASKDKLVDEVKARLFETKSRAEILRLIQSMAEKKKVKSITRWVVKQETRLALHLDLPDEPIDNNASQELIKNCTTVTPNPSSPQQPQGKTNVSSPLKKDALASSNLLDVFAKKGL